METEISIADTADSEIEVDDEPREIVLANFEAVTSETIMSSQNGDHIGEQEVIGYLEVQPSELGVDQENATIFAQEIEIDGQRVILTQGEGGGEIIVVVSNNQDIPCEQSVAHFSQSAVLSTGLAAVDGDKDQMIMVENSHMSSTGHNSADDSSGPLNPEHCVTVSSAGSHEYGHAIIMPSVQSSENDMKGNSAEIASLWTITGAKLPEKDDGTEMLFIPDPSVLSSNPELASTLLQSGHDREARNIKLMELARIAQEFQPEVHSQDSSEEMNVVIEDSPAAVHVIVQPQEQNVSSSSNLALEKRSRSIKQAEFIERDNNENEYYEENSCEQVEITDEASDSNTEYVNCNQLTSDRINSGTSVIHVTPSEFSSINDIKSIKLAETGMVSDMSCGEGSDLHSHVLNLTTDNREVKDMETHEVQIIQVEAQNIVSVEEGMHYEIIGGSVNSSVELSEEQGSNVIEVCEYSGAPCGEVVKNLDGLVKETVTTTPEEMQSVSGTSEIAGNVGVGRVGSWGEKQAVAEDHENFIIVDEIGEEKSKSRLAKRGSIGNQYVTKKKKLHSVLFPDRSVHWACSENVRNEGSELEVGENPVATLSQRYSFARSVADESSMHSPVQSLLTGTDEKTSDRGSELNRNDESSLAFNVQKSVYDQYVAGANTGSSTVAEESGNVSMSESCAMIENEGEERASLNINNQELQGSEGELQRGSFSLDAADSSCDISKSVEIRSPCPGTEDTSSDNFQSLDLSVGGKHSAESQCIDSPSETNDFEDLQPCDSPSGESNRIEQGNFQESEGFPSAVSSEKDHCEDVYIDKEKSNSCDSFHASSEHDLNVSDQNLDENVQDASEDTAVVTEPEMKSASEESGTMSPSSGLQVTQTVCDSIEEESHIMPSSVVDSVVAAEKSSTVVEENDDDDQEIEDSSKKLIAKSVDPTEEVENRSAECTDSQKSDAEDTMSIEETIVEPPKKTYTRKPRKMNVQKLNEVNVSDGEIDLFSCSELDSRTESTQGDTQALDRAEEMDLPLSASRRNKKSATRKRKKTATKEPDASVKKRTRLSRKIHMLKSSSGVSSGDDNDGNTANLSINCASPQLKQSKRLLNKRASAVTSPSNVDKERKGRESVSKQRERGKGTKRTRKMSRSSGKKYANGSPSKKQNFDGYDPSNEYIFTDSDDSEETHLSYSGLSSRKQCNSESPKKRGRPFGSRNRIYNTPETWQKLLHSSPAKIKPQPSFLAKLKRRYARTRTFSASEGSAKASTSDGRPASPKQQYQKAVRPASEPKRSSRRKAKPERPTVIRHNFRLRVQENIAPPRSHKPLDPYACVNCHYETGRMDNLISHVKLCFTSGVPYEVTDMDKRQRIRGEESAVVPVKPAKAKEPATPRQKTCTILFSTSNHSSSRINCEDDKLALNPESKYDFAENDVVWVEWKRIFWPCLVRRIHNEEKRASVMFIDFPSSKASSQKVSLKKLRTFNNAELNKKLLSEGKASQYGEIFLKAVQKAEEFTRKRILDMDITASHFFTDLHLSDHMSDESGTSDTESSPVAADGGFYGKNTKDPEERHHTVVDDDDDEIIMQRMKREHIFDDAKKNIVDPEERHRTVDDDEIIVQRMEREHIFDDAKKNIDPEERHTVDDDDEIFVQRMEREHIFDDAKKNTDDPEERHHTVDDDDIFVQCMERGNIFDDAEKNTDDPEERHHTFDDDEIIVQCMDRGHIFDDAKKNIGDSEEQHHTVADDEIIVQPVESQHVVDNANEDPESEHVVDNANEDPESEHIIDNADEDPKNEPIIDNAEDPESEYIVDNANEDPESEHVVDNADEDPERDHVVDSADEDTKSEPIVDNVDEDPESEHVIDNADEGPESEHVVDNAGEDPESENVIDNASEDPESEHVVDNADEDSEWEHFVDDANEDPESEHIIDNANEDSDMEHTIDTANEDPEERDNIFEDHEDMEHTVDDEEVQQPEEMEHTVDDEEVQQPEKMEHIVDDDEEVQQPEKMEHTVDDDEEVQQPEEMEHTVDDDEEVQQPEEMEHTVDDDEEVRQPEEREHTVDDDASTPQLDCPNSIDEVHVVDIMQFITEGNADDHLVGIYNWQIDSKRHKKFFSADPEEKKYLLKNSWFGPVDDLNEQEILYNYLHDVFTRSCQYDSTDFIFTYIHQVWCPEAIVKAISVLKELPLVEAKSFFKKISIQLAFDTLNRDSFVL